MTNGAIIWFLLGLGYSLQIVASLSLTELFILSAAPILFIKEYPLLRKHGFMPLILLSFLVFIGCLVAIFFNKTPRIFALRGMAVTILLPCSAIVCHWILNKNMDGFKWYLIGFGLSQVLNIFVLQRAVEISMLADGYSGMMAASSIMAGSLFWISRISPFVLAYPRGWYLQCPFLISVFLPFGLSIFSLLISASGRSAALGLLGASVLVLVAGKTRLSIKTRICNHFLLLMLLAIIIGFSFYMAYRCLAMSGILGEKSLEKYEHQSKGGGLIQLIMGGRMDSFCGLLACIDKPIIGFGPWAMDTEGYTEEFLSKYANYEDYVKFMEEKQAYAKLGLTRPNLIPGHSHIVGFWLWYGIFGLVFWMYVLYVLMRYLKCDCSAVPQYFMWIAATTPSFLWAIFFSPFAERMGSMLFISACLMVRAVNQGRMMLPVKMKTELEEYERKH